MAYGGRPFRGLLDTILKPLGGRSEAPWGLFLGLLGASWGLWGASWALLGASWGLLGASWGGRLELLVRVPPLGALLGRLGLLDAALRTGSFDEETEDGKDEGVIDCFAHLLNYIVACGLSRHRAWVVG